MSEELVSHNFPPYSPEPLEKRVPRLGPTGVDLVEKFLLYEARKRISAKSAMKHPYFASLGAAVQELMDGKPSHLWAGQQLFQYVLRQAPSGGEFLV